MNVIDKMRIFGLQQRKYILMSPKEIQKLVDRSRKELDKFARSVK